MGANDKCGINEEAYKTDLPALRVDDRDLPIPVSDLKPLHEQATAEYPGWSNLAGQRHIAALTADPNRGDLWLATAGGLLRWRSGLDRFTRYTSEHGLPGNSMSAMAVAGSGPLIRLTA